MSVRPSAHCEVTIRFYRLGSRFKSTTRALAIMAMLDVTVVLRNRGLLHDVAIFTGVCDVIHLT